MPRRFLVAAIAVAALCAVLFVAIVVGYLMWDRARREDTHELFVRLAEEHLSALEPVEAPLGRPSPAELLVAVKRRRAVDREIAWSADELAAIAREDAALIGETQALWERRHGVTPLLGAAVLTAFGLYYDDQATALDGVVRGLGEAGTWEAWLRESDLLQVRATANRLELALRAARFSGPPSTDALFRGSFRESGLLWGPDCHTLQLTNVSNTALDDCVVLFTLTGTTGERWSDACFAAHWPSGEARAIRVDSSQGPGLPSSVRSVELRAWSKDVSSPPLRLDEPPFGW